MAGDIALRSPWAPHENKAYGTVDRFLDLHEMPVQLAALLAMGLAAWTRQRATLVLAAWVVVWVAAEVAFVLHGWAGVPRYLFEPVGAMCALAGVGIGRVMCALAGVGIGRVIVDLPEPMSRRASGAWPGRGRPGAASASRDGGWRACSPCLQARWCPRRGRAC